MRYLCYNKNILGEGGNNMGQTDSQFKCNIRFMLDAIRDARNEKDTERKDQLLDRILENLQKTLED